MTNDEWGMTNDELIGMGLVSFVTRHSPLVIRHSSFVIRHSPGSGSYPVLLPVANGFDRAREVGNGIFLRKISVRPSFLCVLCELFVFVQRKHENLGRDPN